MRNKLNTIAFSSIVALTAVFGAKEMYATSHPSTAEATGLTKKQVEQIVLDTIKNNPEAIMQSMTAYMESQQKAQLEKAKAAVKNSKNQIFSSTHPSTGNLKGNMNVAIFYDYQCGHCKHMTPVIMEAIKEDSQLHVFFIDLPIFGGNSISLAKVGLAAAKQGKFVEVHEALMKAPAGLTEEKALEIAKKLGLNMEQLKKDMASSDIEKALEENKKLAQAIGLGGTPAIIVEDELSPGAMPKEALMAMIKAKRQATKG